MTKFNLNPNYKKRKIKIPLSSIFKPVYLSIILIIALGITIAVYSNIMQANKLSMIRRHSNVYLSYKSIIDNLDLRQINSSINSIERQITLYKYQRVHQNVHKILSLLSSSYSNYLPAGFVLHSFDYNCDSNGASQTSIEIYYLKNYLDEAKTFSYSLKNYINKINLKEFKENE